MLKYLFVIFIGTCSFISASDADGLVDPNFYKRSIEIEGHIYNYMIIEHSPECPCNDPR